MTDRYALIGKPVGHSKSPFIHSRFAEATGQDLEYGLVEAEPGTFTATVDRLRAEGLRGINITTPFKLDAFAYSTDASERARAAGAVNAMKFEGTDARAENFDGQGVLIDIRDNLPTPIRGSRVLLLGGGGAARGALGPLLGEAPAALVLANRRLAASQALVDGAGPGLVAATYDDLAATGPFDIVLNATSASLHGECPPLPRGVLAGASVAYDMVYGRGLTPFLRLAREAGVARLADGVGMLVEQAAEAFAWWRGVRPSTASVIAALTIPLE